jgi:hypothetical protein
MVYGRCKQKSMTSSLFVQLVGPGLSFVYIIPDNQGDQRTS